MTQFIVNRKLIQTQSSPGAVLLDLLRGELGLKGSKEGCREGDCGACTVLVGARYGSGTGYTTAASCLLPVGDLHGKHIVTIEGLNGEGLSPVQQAMVDEGATQCGFCTPGIVMALTGFLLSSATLSLEDAWAAVEGNICRCTGYASIRRSCERLISQIDCPSLEPDRRLQVLVNAQLIPAWFSDMSDRLHSIAPLNIPDELQEPGILVAGGTDLFVQEADSLLNRPLRFISDDSGLSSIRISNGLIEIGAAVTLEALKQNALLCDTFPAWRRSLNLVSSTLIRNRATVAGNLINASPIGDITIMLLALGAVLNLESSGGERQVTLESFYLDYKRFDLKKGERVVSITFPVPQAPIRFNFEKVSRRQHLDIASVNSAMVVHVSEDTITEARISAGGVAPVPLYLAQSSSWLAGKTLSAETVDELTTRVDWEIAPIDDVRGSAHYKRRLLRRLVIAHFVESFPNHNWEGLVL